MLACFQALVPFINRATQPRKFGSARVKSVVGKKEGE